MVKWEWNPFDPIPPVEVDAKISTEKLYLNLKEAFPNFVADFEQKFTAWQSRWFDSKTPGLLSSALELCELPEYDPLIFLGPKIIPLVVYELTKPGSFIATTLYNHLETNRDAKIDPEDVLNSLTLNRHANLIVELNHERAQRAIAHIKTWKAHCARVKALFSQHSNGDLDADIVCEAYDALVAMGPGIIGHVMLEYSNDQAGSWYKLMYQLVREKPITEAGEDRRKDFESYWLWRDWFEHREHHEAVEEGVTPSYLMNAAGMP